MKKRIAIIAPSKEEIEIMRSNLLKGKYPVNLVVDTEKKFDVKKAMKEIHEKHGKDLKRLANE